MHVENLEIGELYRMHSTIYKHGGNWTLSTEDGSDIYVPEEDVVMYLGYFSVERKYFMYHDYLFFFLWKNEKVLMSDMEVDRVVKDKVR